jgi:L-cystine uptake protein TcyP (sodium:dicarboxylate symporter family)
MEEIIIPIVVFATIFGIFYLFITSRHRERMGLIDKGMDASMLYADKQSQGKNRRLILLNSAFILVGIGVGITFGILLHNATGEEAVYPASIFTMAGLGLLGGIFVGRKMKDD